MPAFEKGMEEGRKDIENLVQNTGRTDFDNTIGALDKAGELLNKCFTCIFCPGFCKHKRFSSEH